MTNRKNLKCIITFSTVSGRRLGLGTARLRPFPMWADSGSSAIRETEINFKKFHVRHLVAAWGFFFHFTRSAPYTFASQKPKPVEEAGAVAIPPFHWLVPPLGGSSLSRLRLICDISHSPGLGSHWGECSSPRIAPRAASMAIVQLANLIKISLHNTRISHAHTHTHTRNPVRSTTPTNGPLPPLCADAMTIRFY